MFAPPSVANAKTAQALQAVVSPHLSMRDQSQPSSSNVSTPGSDGGLHRKKSEPVLSKSAPSSTPDFIALDREKKAMSSSPASPVLDEAPSLQIQESNGTTVDGIPPETNEAPKENLLSAARSDSSQESVARSSVTSLQSSRVAVSRASSSAATTPSTDLTRKKTKKNRKSAWYNLISPTYKSKCDDFRRIFKDVPEGEMLIVDYSCALQREILAHGRLYVTQNYLCFYANIFRWETTVVIKCKDITSMTKEKTALVIPNAIQCSTEAGDRYFFTSFAARDKSYLMLFRLWQNSLIEQPMSIAECWRWIHCSYGDELGLSSDDEDYIAPDDLANCRSMDIRSLTEAPVEEAEIARPPSASDISLPVPGLKSSVIPVNSPDQDLKSSSSDEPDIEDEGCPNTHEMKKYLDRTFALDIDHTFTCLFTASEFYQELSSRRKITNIVFGNWEPSESEDVKQERVLSYTVNINHAMAKSCVTTEKQNLHRRSKPGMLYSIDCEFSNSGVPYADTFVVNQHLCIEKEGENRCRLKLFSDIEFRKPVWMMKGFIERNTVQGTLDFASALQRALDEEARRLAKERGQAVPALPGADGAVTNPINGSGTTEQSDGVIAASCATHRNLIIFLSIAVGILLVLNIYFMRKTFYNEINDEDLEVEHDVPNTAAGWKSVYFRSQVRHRRQLQDLQRLVDRSLQGLENMKIVFSRVKDVIAEKAAAIPSNSKSEL